MINLYTGNHGKKDGIQDYIDILSYICKSRGTGLKVSEEISDSGVNIVIDEFTNLVSNNRIRDIRALSESVRFVYILSEFIEKRFMVKSFNHFGGILDSAFIACINIYFRWIREDFKKACFKDYFVFFLLSPVLLFYGILVFKENLSQCLSRTHGISTLFSIGANNRSHKLAYMHMRYLGFEAMISYADAVVLSHDSMRKGYDEFCSEGGYNLDPVGVLYPEFSSIDLFENYLDSKECYIEMTGSITKYRKNYVEEMNRKIFLLGLNNYFGMTNCYSFHEILKIKPSERAAFSLHPPQSAEWKYSSPTRIYRSLYIDKSIPILTKKFDQHPIEDVCLVLEGSKTLLQMYDLHSSPATLAEFLNTRIDRYLEKAKVVNNVIFENFIELSENSCSLCYSKPHEKR